MLAKFPSHTWLNKNSAWRSDLLPKCLLRFRAQATRCAAFSYFSAASCYKNAGRIAEAIARTTSALSLTGASSFAEEIRQFRDECQNMLSQTGHRVIRGIVRNGAVYPSEQGVLVEGEWVTITAA